jgi:hypothetical protein
VLGHDGNDDRRVFRALAFVDGHSWGRNEGVELVTSCPGLLGHSFRSGHPTGTEAIEG